MHSKRYQETKGQTVWTTDQIEVFLRVLESGDTKKWESLPPDFIEGWTSKTRGGSVFHYVAQKGRSPEKCVPFLVERGLDIQALTKNGRSVLEYALFRDESSGVQWARALMDAGFDMHQLKCAGSTLLSNEVSCNRSRLVRLLIQNGAPRSPPDQEWAAIQGIVSADAVQILTMKPEDAPSESMQILEDLLPASKGDLDRLFLYAVSAGYYQWARHWMRLGADIKAQNVWGDSALHLLAYMACTYHASHGEIKEFLSELVDAGIDCDVLDKKGKTSAEQFESIVRDMAPRRGVVDLDPHYWWRQVIDAQASKIASKTLRVSDQPAVVRL